MSMLPRPVEDPFDQVSETINHIWANLGDPADHGAGLRIAFVAPEPQSGTTTLAACTAIGLAQHLRQDVTLIEANIRTPALARYMRLAPSPGLAEILHGESTLDEALMPTGVAGLQILPAGTPRTPIPGEFAAPSLLSSFNLAARLCRYLILDLPPILTCPEARLLLRHAGKSVLVLRSRQTSHRTAKKAARLVTNSQSEIIGTVLNRHRPDVPAWFRRFTTED